MLARGLFGDDWYPWPIWSYYEGQFVSADYCKTFSAGEPGHYDWQMERGGWCSRIIFMDVCMCMYGRQKGKKSFLYPSIKGYLAIKSCALSLSVYPHTKIHREEMNTSSARNFIQNLLGTLVTLFNVHSEETKQNTALEYNDNNRQKYHTNTTKILQW